MPVSLSTHISDLEKLEVGQEIENLERVHNDLVVCQKVACRRSCIDVGGDFSPMQDEKLQ
jgi:hypothetical protein